MRSVKFVSMMLLACAFLSVSASQSQAQDWTYPGDLRTHLEQGHGVSTAGLGRFNMLNLHDSLHESTNYSYQASFSRDRFHLPGRPVERAANLLSAVRPVQRATATIGAVVKAKPVRSTLKFLFF